MTKDDISDLQSLISCKIYCQREVDSWDKELVKVNQELEYFMAKQLKEN